MSRNLLSTVSRFLLGLAAGSLVTEIALRLIEVSPAWRVLPVLDASLYGPDPDTGYAHRAGASGIRTQENRARIIINPLGLRDRLERTEAKPTGVIRWAVAGDSIVDAQQVANELTFAALAEEELTRTRGARVEVVNLGLAGARPAVIAERLRSRGSRLHLDGIVVIVSAGEFLNPAPDDPTEYAGYAPGPDGKAIVSHAFRDSAAYRVRTGSAGRLLYWVVDHSRLALILNNRKNVGLMAELGTASLASAATPCADTELARLESVFGNEPPGFSGARRDAFLRDVASFAAARNIPAILAMRNLSQLPCPDIAARLDSLRTAIQTRVAVHGLVFLDLDAATRRQLEPGVETSHMSGFGSRLGGGHLNSLGHKVYAQALIAAIEARLSAP